MNFLERLKTRPERERKHIARWVTGVLFVALMGVWLAVERLMSSDHPNTSGGTLAEPFRAIYDVIKNNPSGPSFDASSSSSTTPLSFSSPAPTTTIDRFTTTPNQDAESTTTP